MVKVKINDPHLSATVLSLLSLCSIPVGKGDILICDTPSQAEGCRGVLVLYSARGYLNSREHSHLTQTYSDAYVPIRCPFSFDMFCSAVRQLLTSTDKPAPSPVHDMSVTPEGTVSYKGKTARLSDREMALFTYLRDKGGKTVSRDELKMAVWKNETEEGTNIVDVYISYLRKKLAPVFGKGVILSERGQGYSLSIPKE